MEAVQNYRRRYWQSYELAPLSPCHIFVAQCGAAAKTGPE